MSVLPDDDIRKLALKKFVENRSISFQWAIREASAEILGGDPISNLSGATVSKISKPEAESIIRQYEWLGTLGQARAFYGLFSADRRLIGCACFGLPTGQRAGDICGKEFRSKAVSLIRGACIHTAPKNSASFLISKAVKLARSEYGWQIFYAYADPEAGEIGTVYQACNWFYLGQGVGRTPGRLRQEWLLPDGRQMSSRYLRHMGLRKKEAIWRGWKLVYTLPKHKYVWFEGDRRERHLLISKCRYQFQPYPKGSRRS